MPTPPESLSTGVPAVSVVMSVFNGERFLAEAIDSILNQSFDDFEFLILDDGSTDGSSAILDSYQAKDPHIRLVRQENRGLVHALNRGCSLAQGKYIARMDADDVAAPERLRLQTEFMDAHPEVGALGSRVEFMDADGRPLSIRSEYPSDNHQIQQALLQMNVLWHPAVLLRKSILAEVGGYRHVKYAEDYDLWLRIAERSQLANHSEPLLRYRMHPEQVSATHRRQQILGAMAAQASAALRRSGRQDQLDSVTEITPQTLRDMGVAERELQTSVARGFLTWMRNQFRSGQYALALETFATLRSSAYPQADRWIMADAYLLAARIYWRRRRFAASILSCGRALKMRPVMLGRPIKEALLWFKTRYRVAPRASAA